MRSDGLAKERRRHRAGNEREGRIEKESPVVQPSALRMASEFHRALSPVAVRPVSGFRSDRNLLPSSSRPHLNRKSPRRHCWSGQLRGTGAQRIIREVSSLAPYVQSKHGSMRQRYLEDFRRVDFFTKHFIFFFLIRF